MLHLCEHMGDCQNYGPFLGPYYNTGPNTGPNLGDPKRDHNFDNPPYTTTTIRMTMLLFRDSSRQENLVHGHFYFRRCKDLEAGVVGFC